MAFWKPGQAPPGESLVEVEAEPDNAPTDVQDKVISIDAKRDQLLYALETFSTVIVQGEPGPGKTTRIPPLLVEAGWTQTTRKIYVTQPRRIAAISAAKQIQKGSSRCRVGYAVRFEAHGEVDDLDILFVTDGTLLRMMMRDPLLLNVSVVMLDEVHERSVATDIAIGLLRKVQIRRGGDLRIILSSATLDVEEMVTFFGGRDHVGVVSLGRQPYPVDVLYSSFAPVDDYIVACEETVRMIIRSEKNGPRGVGLLIFVTSAEECLDLASRINAISSNGRLRALPLFASLSLPEQQAAISPAAPGDIKVVVATNLAETSVTVPGISFVVDCGMMRARIFDGRAGIDSLQLVPISQASARQRAGRAGRTQAGVCFRLYSESFYTTQMALATPPEIVRCDLTSPLLQLKSLGIENVMKFPFPSRPNVEMIAHALELLHGLGAIDADARLTELGTQLAEIPLDPKLGRCLLEADKVGCGHEMATILAMEECGGSHVFHTAKAHQWRALEEARAPFAVAEGDLITYLNVFASFEAAKMSSKWCEKKGLAPELLSRAAGIRRVLLRHVSNRQPPRPSAPLIHLLRRSIASGFHVNLARVQPDGTYQLVRHAPSDSRRRATRFEGTISLSPHPSSVVFDRFPTLIVFCSSIFQPGSERAHMQGITVVTASIVAEVAPHLYRLPSSSREPEHSARR